MIDHGCMLPDQPPVLVLPEGWDEVFPAEWAMVMVQGHALPTPSLQADVTDEEMPLAF